MAIWYNLWSFGIFSQAWYIWTKKILATLTTTRFQDASASRELSVIVKSTARNVLQRKFSPIARPFAKEVFWYETAFPGTSAKNVSHVAALK
jgi:hypothetical protein